MRGISQKTERFTESVIRGMTRLCEQYGGVNLAQGFPDFAAPAQLKEAAKAAIDADYNQYAVTWGTREFRQAIAAKMASYNGVPCDPDTEITVTCGSTEAMIAALLAVVNPGDEIVIFEPFYENYGPDAIISGASVAYVPLRPPHFAFDPDELRAACNAHTKAIILNTPHNPSGHVFTRTELEHVAAVCQKFDCLAITDEIYEHILYDGRVHVPLASLDGMRERTVTISGVSKTYSVTGWRIGWCLAAPALSGAIRKVHDFLTVGAPAPLQDAAAVALELPDDYYTQLAEGYRVRRDHLIPVLDAAGFRTFTPGGAYYVMTDISEFGFDDDVEFARHLVATAGVAAVPGSSFYSDPRSGRQRLRFHFARRRETLEAAAERLARFAAPTTPTSS
jgi:aminotransferase